MMSCANRDSVRCDPRSEKEGSEHQLLCGNDFAIPYFISFYVLCSFLVGSVWDKLKVHNSFFHSLLIHSILSGHQLIRSCHHGQLRLLDQRLVHSWTTSFRWIRSTLVWIWSRCQVSVIDSRNVFFRCDTLLLKVFGKFPPQCLGYHCAISRVSHLPFSKKTTIRSFISDFLNLTTSPMLSREWCCSPFF